MKTSTGPVKRAMRVTISGQEGVGKSTLASLFPKPYFLDCESGTLDLEVERGIPENLQDIHDKIAKLPSEGYRTLVIDTIDWCEQLVIADMLRSDGKTNIEDYGYGKGYVLAEAAMSNLLKRLQTLIDAGIHVVLLAHTAVARFDMPGAADSFNRYALKLTRKSAPLVKEWSDMVLFLHFDTKIAKDADTKKTRGVGGKERVITAENSAIIEAKNRHGLPADMPWKGRGKGVPPMPKELAAVIADDMRINAPKKDPKSEGVESDPKGLSQGEIKDKAKDTLKATEDVSGLSKSHQLFYSSIASRGSEEKVNGYLSDGQFIEPGQTWRDLEEESALDLHNREDDTKKRIKRWAQLGDDVGRMFWARIASRGSEAELNAFLVDKEKIQEGDDWAAAPKDYLARAAAKRDAFIEALLKHRQKKTTGK